MNEFILRLIKPCIIAAVCLFFLNYTKAQCSGNLVVNGSFDGIPGEDETASGWSHGSTPDINDASGTLHTTPSYVWTGIPVVSPNGGTWQNIFSTEYISQIITVVPGTSYTLQFDYAAQGIQSLPMDYQGPVGVNVYINDVLMHTSPLDMTQYSWEHDSYTFIPSGANIVLKFTASKEQYVAIDGMCFAKTGANTQAQFAFDICQGDSVRVNNKTYKTTGIYRDTLRNSAGFDSIITTTLTVHPSYSKTQNINLCSGQTILVGSHTYSLAGNYRDTLKTTKNCDSIIVTNLTIRQLQTSSQNAIICPGGSYVVGTHTYMQAGTYKDTLRTNSGCDSVVTTTISIAALQTASRNVSICSNEKLVIGNHTYTANGIYKDTIKGGAGCDTLLTTTLTVYPKPIVNLGADISVCPDSVIALDAGNAGAAFFWNNNQTTQQISAATAGTYIVTVTKNNCSTNDTIIIQHKPVYIVNLGADAVLCNKDSLTLNVATNGGSYVWQDGSTSPVYTISQEGIYSVKVTTECAVSADTITVVHEECDCQYYIPTAFSPNHDGVNDAFGVANTCTGVTYFKLEIFNRWNQLLFEADAENKKWDGFHKGNEQELDSYIYILNYTQNGKNYYKKGVFTLLK
ncbi:MAG: gliding motility-associated C-terminal domain-containing protein [Chitinophagales bacterium]